MAKYYVQQTVESAVQNVVEANTPQEAIEKAGYSGNWEPVEESTTFQDEFFFSLDGVEWIEFK
jgi:hypothetical protein